MKVSKVGSVGDVFRHGDEDLLRRALGLSPVIPWVADAEGRVLGVGEGWLALTGSPPEEALGEGWNRAIHPADRPGVEGAWAEARRTGEPFELEKRLRHGSEDSGSWRWVRVRGAPSQGPDGRPARWYGTVEDIHDRRLAEDLLAASEARFRATFEQAAVGIAHVAPDGTFLRVNGRLCEITGHPREALLRLRFQDITHPADLDADLEQAEALRAGRIASYAMEKRYLRADGSVVWVNLTGSLVRDPATGVPDYFIAVVEDISARKAAEARAEAAALTRGLLQGSPNCVKLLDAEGRLLTMNAAGLRALEIEAFETVLGRPWEALWPEAGRAGLRRALAEARAGGIARFRGFCPTARGAPRWWENEVWPLPGGEGRLVVVSRDVTEAQRVEAALRASEEHLRWTVELNPQVPWTADAEGNITDFSRRWLELTGLTREAALGGGWVRAPHPDDLPRMVDAWTRSVRTGEPYDVEHRIRLADGSFRWMRSRAFPRRDPATGRVLHWYGTTEDIHERHEAEAALRLAEERLRLALEGAEGGVWDWDVATGAVRFGERWCAMLGYAPEEVEPSFRAWERLVHPEDLPGATRALADHLEGRRPAYEGEHRLRAKDGRWVWVLARGKVVARDTGGRPLRAVGTHADITARKAAETALAESEARFRTLADAMPQMVWSTRPDGFHDYYNSRWYEFTGAPPGTTDGEGWNGMFHPADQEHAWARWRRALATGEPYEIEYRLRRRDGTYRWVLGRALPVRDGQGRITRWFGTCTDIEEQVRAREALSRHGEELEARVAERTRALTDAAKELAAEMRRREEAQAALLQSQKLEALGQLTGGVAHDFNNVLAAVQGGFRLLERRLGGDPQGEELARHGLRAAERGKRLIAQLMAFARREELRPALTDPAAALRNAEDMIGHAAGDRTRCVLEIAPGVWPVIVDPVRLETVLLNLAANARDAMPGGGRLKVALRNAAPDELPPELPQGGAFVLFSVADTGTGMDGETLRRATEPFFTTKPAGSGTGLGLASAHGFAAQSGGALRLRSAPGEGTTVELFLPRAGVLPAEAGAVGAGEEASALDRSRHGGATILLVDDDDGVRPVVAGMLRDLGYRVVEAASAETAEALAHAEGEALGMLLTDVAMPGATGPALAARLRAERPDLPVLYLTGHGTAGLRDAPVLRKPFTEAALARAVLAGLRRLEGDAGGPPAAAVAPSERLRERLRRPALREAYLRWLDLRGAAGGNLPTPGAFAPDNLPEEAAGDAFLAEVLDGGTGGFRFLRFGRALEERLGRSLTGALVGGGADDGVGAVLGGSIGAAYRRCAATRAPLYDYARFALGDGRPVLLERIVLPLSADGAGVTHVAGVAVFTELGTGREDGGGD